MKLSLSIPVAIALIALCPAQALAGNLQWAHISPIRGQSYVHRHEYRRSELRDYLLLRDSLSTAPRGLAHLRFNDGSLVRLSGNSLFNFEPNTRNFTLWRGLSLLVLPQGTVSRVRTNNVVVGTQGTVLAVSYQPLNEVSTVVMVASSAVVSIPGKDVLLQAGQALVYVGATNSAEVFVVDLAYLTENSAIAVGGFLDVAEVRDAVAQQQAGDVPALPSVGGDHSGAVELPAFGVPVPSFDVEGGFSEEEAEEGEAIAGPDPAEVRPVIPIVPDPVVPVDDVPMRDEPGRQRPENGNNGIGTGAREKAVTGIEPAMQDLQSRALPLGDTAVCGNDSR